jgi:phosphoserine aminotransferase
MAIIEESQSLIRELLEVPQGYHVLFLGGGASMQFCMVPYNLMQTKAAYLNTGSWASKALKEAAVFGEAIEVASSKDRNFSYIPKGYKLPADADYFHITTNNTIYGTEIREDLDVPMTLVADMSSDIFSRPMDVSKYGIIYGGAQKNLAPSGLAFIIVREDILGKVDRPIPTMLDYRTHIDKGSMFHTPPVVPIFAALQTLRWLKDKGGVAAMEKINIEKAALLYDEIDRNPMFKCTVEDEADRSLMNICFVMTDEYKDREADFLALAGERGMVGIKGHRSVGGFRASTYNALARESVVALIDTMKEFEK